MNFEDTSKYIANKFGIDLSGKPAFHINNFGRDMLGYLFMELGCDVGAEIGTEQGVYAEELCKSGVNLYCVDPWLAYRGYREHVSQDKLDGFYEKTRMRLSPYKATLIRKTSLDAAKDFEDESLGFVYIDANHEFKHVVDDIYAWTPKVKKGGIIAGHDFSRRRGDCVNNVKDVVPAYAYAKGINPWFVINEVRGSASWLWAKI